MYSVRQERNIGVRDKLKRDIPARRHSPLDFIVCLRLSELSGVDYRGFSNVEEKNKEAKKKVLGRTNRILSCDAERIENGASKVLLLHVYLLPR
jgi:hypothetical protein